MSEYEIHVTEYQGITPHGTIPRFRVDVVLNDSNVESLRGFSTRWGAKRAGKRAAKEHANPRRIHWLYKVKA